MRWTWMLSAAALVACPDDTPAPLGMNDAFDAAQMDVDAPRPDADVASSLVDADGGDVLAGPDTLPDTVADAVADQKSPGSPDTQDTGLDVGVDLSPGAASMVLSAPRLSLPYVVAGGGGAQATFTITNTGAAAGALLWDLSGDATLSTDALPATLAAGEVHTVTVSFSGSPTPLLAGATLTVIADGEGGSQPAERVEIWAVAGDSEIGDATLDVLDGPPSTPSVTHGTSMTITLPTAPFDSDPSVLVFVPDGFWDRGLQDMVVHFHGHNTTLASTVPYHGYREMVHVSGRNAVLVVPQGPVNQASGDFGRLMDAGGLATMLDDVLALLYREGFVSAPALGDVFLTAHSGGYQAVAVNLGNAWAQQHVVQVGLFDAMYGYMNAYYDFIVGGGRLRSNTTGGSTGSVHATLQGLLDTAGVAWSDATDHATLRASAPVLAPTSAPHNDVTWHASFYLEHLRWCPGATARGPRVELLSVADSGGAATASWRTPSDPAVTHFEVQAQGSSDGSWSVLATAPPGSDQATFLTPALGADVRVVGVIPAVPPAERRGSDVYRLDPAATTLVVDGFDRTLRGSFAGPWHDFAARVGAAVPGGVATASNESVREGTTALADYATVVWLLGDESTGDRTFDAAEQAVATAYVAAGGRLIVSGSEIAWDLDNKGGGASFLAGLGASYAADDAGTLLAQPAGPLAALSGDIPFGGAGAPYGEDFPDVLGTVGAAVALLHYDSGGNAAVGLAGSSVVLGFPLELVDDDASLAALMAALTGF